MLNHQLAHPHYRTPNQNGGAHVTFAVRGLFKLVLALAISLRFSLLPHEMFRDRVNYLWSIENSSYGLGSLYDSNVPLLLNEPLFDVVSFILSALFSAEIILSIYVFINCFAVLCFVLFNRGPILYSALALSLLLVIPYFYGGVLGAVRQGLGLNFVLFALMVSKNVTDNRVVFALAVASLFHVMFYIFLALVVTYRVLRLVSASDRVILFFMFLLVVLLGLTWSWFTPYLSSTQSYEEFDSRNSGLTMMGWGVIFLIFVYSYIRIKRSSVVVNDALFKLVLLMFFCFFVFYWMAPGPYRLLYSCAPLLVCALSSHFNVYSSICYMVTFLYSIVLMLIGSGAGSMNVEFGLFVKTVFFG